MQDVYNNNQKDLQTAFVSCVLSDFRVTTAAFVLALQNFQMTTTGN